MGEVDVVPDAECPDCFDEIGPPPDGILNLPPPPLPYFIQLNHYNETSLCSNQCIWAPQFQGVEFVELTHREDSFREGTWVLIISGFCLGVLLIGGLVAFLLLTFRSKHNGKNGVQASATATTATTVVRTNKRCDSVFYPFPADPDGRVLWATLTPAGTTHHYTAAGSHPEGTPVFASCCRPAFPPSDNLESAVFVDSDSQTPLIESYQLNDLTESDGASNSSTLRKIQRPRVSSPTRIENPNLPPLNLHPLRGTARRATLQRKDSDLQNSSPT